MFYFHNFRDTKLFQLNQNYIIHDALIFSSVASISLYKERLNKTFDNFLLLQGPLDPPVQRGQQLQLPGDAGRPQLEHHCCPLPARPPGPRQHSDGLVRRRQVDYLSGC